MNKCPKCQRNYEDETLSFCLEDGEKLVAEQFSDSNSTPTVMFKPKTVVVSNEPKPKSSLGFYLAFGAAGLFIVLLAVGAMGYLFLRSDPTKNKVLLDVNNSQVKENPKPDETVKTGGKTKQCALSPSLNEDVAKISFPATSYKIADESLSIFPKIAESLKQLPDNCVVEIGVHSDNVGNAEMNRKLTEERAKAIKAELIKNSIKEDKITAIGYGDSQPIADNSTLEGKARNRRIELKIIDKGSSDSAKNESDSNAALDFTNPKTISELENKGLTIVEKKSPKKINPLLLLWVSIDSAGNILLNGQNQGSITDEKLSDKLKQVFQERGANKVFKEGTNEVEKTVVFEIPAKINREVFEKVYEVIKKSDASPILLLKP